MKKLVNHNLGFSLELIIGLSSFCIILIIGYAGMSLFAFLSFLAFMKTKKADERELLLLYKTGIFTLCGLYLSMFPVYYFLPNINWLFVMICSFAFFHGLSGLIIFSNE